jgi:thiosulfate/3-mercaptopyruvate sulfurtransferase
MPTLLIEPDALAALIVTGDVAVFDCSFDLTDPAAGRAAFVQGHVPGAHYLHLDDALAGPTTGTNGRHPLPDPDGFAAMLRAHGVRAGMQVVAYDRSGSAFAARLWWMLRWLGHDAVAVLDGGLEAWTAAGHALEQGAAQDVTPGDFSAHAPDMTRIVDAADLLANLERPGRTIIDARTPARFAGEAHPLDAAAGHIPGARNRFYLDNLEGGRFKAPDALRADFAALLPDLETETVVQCGSGVTACHNALAMALAGLPEPRLYPGSWSEWTADPARPVARDRT